MVGITLVAIAITVIVLRAMNASHAQLAEKRVAVIKRLTSANRVDSYDDLLTDQIYEAAKSKGIDVEEADVPKAFQKRLEEIQAPREK